VLHLSDNLSGTSITPAKSNSRFAEQAPSIRQGKYFVQIFFFAHIFVDNQCTNAKKVNKK
jgi:hypothetical protein